MSIIIIIIYIIFIQWIPSEHPSSPWQESALFSPVPSLAVPERLSTDEKIV